jgi:CRP/FNR family cyclic AMP-dependent transcriptional regulator
VIRLICDSEWFAGISKEKIAQIVDQSFIQKYSANDFIYMVGDPQTNLFCVIEGRVKVSIMGKGGDDFVLAIWEKGTCFGESSLHEDGRMPLEARVLIDSTLLAIPHTVINTILENDQALYQNIMLGLIGRAKGLYRLIEIFLFSPLHARVAARILHFLDLFGQPSDDGVILPMKLSQSDLAGMSGGSRQRVNQIFRKWSQQGVMTKPGRYYVVHDVPALKAMLEEVED